MARQSDDERAEVILPARRILMGFEHTPWTIGVDLVEFSSDGNVNQARNAGKEFIRGLNRIEVKAECFGVDLSREPIRLIVY